MIIPKILMGWVEATRRFAVCDKFSALGQIATVHHCPLSVSWQDKQDEVMVEKDTCSCWLVEGGITFLVLDSNSH